MCRISITYFAIESGLGLILSEDLCPETKSKALRTGLECSRDPRHWYRDHVTDMGPPGPSVLRAHSCRGLAMTTYEVDGRR